MNRYFLKLLLLGCFLIGCSDLFAAVADPIHYISNRVKIQRPLAAATQQQASAQKPVEKEISSTITSKEKPESEAAPGATPEKPAEKPAELSLEKQNELFLGSQGRFYTREGKVDPFEPFLRIPESQASKTEQEKLHIRPPQTPLERFDLSQLKLTAILQAPGKSRALVQESSGKGYIVDEGTYIGNKGGQVTKILNDRIVIEEKYLDVLGKIAVRDIELKLKKGED